MREGLLLDHRNPTEDLRRVDDVVGKPKDPRGYRHIQSFPKPTKPKTSKECTSPRNAHIKELNTSKRGNERALPELKSPRYKKPSESLERVLEEDESLMWPSFARCEDVDLSLGCDPALLYKRPKMPETEEQFVLNLKPTRRSVELPALVNAVDNSPQDSPLRSHRSPKSLKQCRSSSDMQLVRQSLGCPSELKKGRYLREAEKVEDFPNFDRKDRYIRRKHRRVTSPAKLHNGKSRKELSKCRSAFSLKPFQN
mmetsp:Transcript_4042/g.4470  ORF Transcript_4042/g.4470 Transcript_4042/m.4470 type:complete len:254 (-) Transcript_4042:295-1056(-)